MTDDRGRSKALMLDERRDIRDLLTTLTAEQWKRESLCTGWTVRDLTAHLVGWDDLLIYRTRSEHARAFLRFSVLFGRSLGNMVTVNRRIQSWHAGEPPEVLVQQFAADDGDDLEWLFDGSNAHAHLAEHVIHHQDIRRPLGLPRTVPAERLVAALDGVTSLPDARSSARPRLKEHRFEATDVDWTGGQGPTVRGTGEAILMTLAGRPTTDELDGLG